MFKWNPGAISFNVRYSQRILDPRALLFCAWLRRSRGLGNPGWKVSSHWLSWATIRSVSDRVIHVHARTEQHTIGKRSSGFKGHGSSLFPINDALHGPNSQDLAIFFPQSFQEPLVMKHLWSDAPISSSEPIPKQEMARFLVICADQTKSGLWGRDWGIKRWIWHRSQFIVG